MGINVMYQIMYADHVTTVCRAGYYQLRLL